MKTIIQLSDRTVSVSALTEANVADLQTIHDRMQVLTERAELILHSAKEVFPAAQSGWLRRIKSALGMLPVKDCHTLEDTLRFCQRLVSNNGVDDRISNPLEWANQNKYVLKYKRRVVTKKLPDRVILISVFKKGAFVGTLSKYEGSWIFIRAQLDFPKGVDFTKSDLVL